MQSQVQRLIAARIGLAFLTLLLVSAVVFIITSLLPGDAAQEALGQAATPAAVAALRHRMGLDESGLQRYLEWLVHLATGNFGVSLSNSRQVNVPIVVSITAVFPEGSGLGIAATGAGTGCGVTCANGTAAATAGIASPSRTTAI